MISDYIHDKLHVIAYPCRIFDAVEIRAWMPYEIAQFYVNSLIWQSIPAKNIKLV